MKAKPNSVVDKVVNQLSASSSATTASSTAQAAAAAISKYANMFTSSSSTAKIASPASKPTLPQHLAHANGTRSGAMTPVHRPGLQRADSIKGDMVNKGLEDRVLPQDGVLTVEMSERMLKWHAEAVGRVMELSAGDV